MIKTIKPISRIAKIEEEINRIIGEVFYRKKDYFSLDEGWVPCIDIYEKDNKITIETELPGVSQRNVTILLHSNRIEIRGIRHEIKVNPNGRCGCHPVQPHGLCSRYKGVIRRL